MLDSSLWRIRVRVSGRRSLAKLGCSGVGSIGVLEEGESIDWRLSEFERDWRLLLEAEEEVVVEAVVEEVEEEDWSAFRVRLRVGAMESGVEDLLLIPILRV